MLGRPKNLEINVLLKDAGRCAKIKKRFGYAASNYEVAAMHYKEILFHEKAASCLTMAFFYYQIEKKDARDSGRSDDAKFSDERANEILDKRGDETISGLCRLFHQSPIGTEPSCLNSPLPHSATRSGTLFGPSAALLPIPTHRSVSEK